ncbi:MAG: hypothetical protein ABR538_08950 [Candidatus Binatia bacterium]
MASELPSSPVPPSATPGALPSIGRLRLVFLFVVGLAACWRFDPLGALIPSDNQIYFYIAERAASGIPPHVSQFDPKNALSMLLTALAIAFGRAVGADDLMAARALAIFVTAAVPPLLYLVTRRLGGSSTMAWTAAAVPLLFPDYLMLAVGGARPKVFLVFFELLWVLAAASGRPLLLGVATGLCFLVWQPALLLLLAAAASMLFREHGRLKSLFLVAAGTAAPILAYESYFLWHGALADQVYQSLVFPASYGKPARSPFVVGQSLLYLNGPVTLRTVLLCAWTLLLALFWTAALAAPRRMWRRLRGRPAVVAVVLAATGTLAFNLYDYQGFPDRLFLLPFLAIVAGVVAGAVVDRAAGMVARRSDPGRLRPWLEAGAVLVTGLLLLDALPDRRGRVGPLVQQRTVAARAAKMADEGKTIYAMGPVHLLALERRSNFNRYGYFPIRIRAWMSNRMKLEKPLLPVVGGKLPDIVLESRREIPIHQRWLKRFYRKGRYKAFASQDIDVWQRVRKIPVPPKAIPF